MFIAFIFFAIFAIVAFVTRSIVKRSSTFLEDTKKVWEWVPRVLTVLAVLFFFIGSIATVSTKNVGIETTFGKTSGELSNGFHLKWPWVNVTEMDAAIQTDNYSAVTGCQATPSTTCGDPLEVRIANQQTAFVHVSIRWRIDPNEADSLYQNYRSFENLRDSLVTRELTAAVNQQFEGYNALNSVQLTDASGNPTNNTNPALSVYANRVTTQMRQEISPQIEVLSVIIPFLSFDPATQARLNTLNTQQAATRQAQASLATNQAQSAANSALAQSVNTSPNVLVSRCLDILEQAWAKNGQAPPAGFSCWPGGSTVSSVIASSGSGK